MPLFRDQDECFDDMDLDEEEDAESVWFRPSLDSTSDIESEDDEEDWDDPRQLRLRNYADILDFDEE